MHKSWNIKFARDKEDSLDLRYGVWPNENKHDRYVIFLNGRTEWIEKYHYLPADLGLPTDVGFATMDHRGQGASGGARATIDHYDSFASDTAAVIEQIVHGRPYVVMGHSMGGLIALYATMSGAIKPESLVLLSPLLRLPQHPLPNPVARSVSKLFSSIKFGSVSTGAGSHTKGIPFETNKLTHHSELYEAMRQTPYPLPGATFSWVNQTFAACDYVFNSQNLASLTTPTLLMAGSKEDVVDPQGFRDWVQLASKGSQAKIKYRMINGAKHELLSEIDQYYQPTLVGLREWFKDFLSPPQ
jgi:alpha-beta hydrolase superfamily lysophospholipase